MKYISWRELTHMKASKAAAYLREGANVTVDGSVEMVLQNVDVAKNRVRLASNEATAASNEARPKGLQNVDRTSVASGVEATEKGLEARQNVDKADLSRIPGVFRGMLAKNPFPVTEEQERAIAEHIDRGILDAMGAPEPEVIHNVVRYERGKRYEKGTKVAVYNSKTKQTEIREAPETDVEGNVVWGRTLRSAPSAENCADMTIGKVCGTATI